MLHLTLVKNLTGQLPPKKHPQGFGPAPPQLPLPHPRNAARRSSFLRKPWRSEAVLPHLRGLRLHGGVAPGPLRVGLGARNRTHRTRPRSLQMRGMRRGAAKENPPMASFRFRASFAEQQDAFRSRGFGPFVGSMSLGTFKRGRVEARLEGNTRSSGWAVECRGLYPVWRALEPAVSSGRPDHFDLSENPSAERRYYAERVSRGGKRLAQVRERGGWGCGAA